MGIAKIEVNVSINVSNRAVERRAVDTALAICGHWLTMHLFKGNVLVPGAHWSVNDTKSVNKIVKYAWLGQILWEKYKPFRGEGVLFKTVGEKERQSTKILCSKRT